MDILCLKMQFPEDVASNEEMRKYNQESNEEISDKSQMRNVMLSFFFLRGWELYSSKLSMP